MRIPPKSWHGRLAAAVLVAVLAGPSARGEATSPPAAPREEAYQEFRRLFDAGQYEAATVQARRVVELTEQSRPVVPDELQVALMNLAVTQRHSGDYVGAEASLLRVIELIEASGRRTSPRLARAHALLAGTYYDARRYDLAAASFERAVALNRRAEGLFNESQLPMLDKYVHALTELGRYEDALVAQRYALRVVGKRHGERSLPFARQLDALGRWYSRVGAYEASRTILRRAEDLVASLPDASLAERVAPLTGLAENARRWLSDPQLRDASADEARRTIFGDPTLPTPPGLSSSTIAAEGLRALERAVAIVAEAPDAPPALAAGVRAQLGDWHQARGDTELALPNYRAAWQLAGTAPDAGALRESLFGAPLLLYYLVPDSWNRYAQRPPDEVTLRHVELELVVGSDGQPRDPQPPADADAGDRLVEQTLRAAGTARYRPRLVDGEPVDTPGVRFVQPFYVLRADDPQPEPSAPPPTPAQGGG